MLSKRSAFTLIEVAVVVVIIIVLATMSMVLLVGVKAKANDIKRKAELSQIGKFLTVSCYLPDGGAGTYDLVDLINELKAKDTKYSQLNAKVWRDPKSGTDTKSNYLYQVTADNKCVLYANLENSHEAVTLSTISEATPGGGSGVFMAGSDGPNGSDKYFQVSN
jgi:Tfp pilus assembly protein PilE